MTAASVTGTGSGDSGQRSRNLSAALGPQVIFAGFGEASEGDFSSPPASPPDETSRVTFPYALPGGPDAYVVIVTGIGTGYVNVAARFEDDDGNFTGFTAIAEGEGEFMYIVASVGSRPIV